MRNNGFISQVILFSVLIVVFFFVGLFVFPWSRFNWGKVSVLPSTTVTVIGEAQGEQKNQIASFNASVTSTNDDKQKAIDDVNKKMTDLIAAVKSFGIADDDIKTQNISVYQQPRPIPMMYPVPVPTGVGQWYANNSIEITLRDITKASNLADLLNKSGATGVNGPNYTAGSTQSTQVDLTAKAVENARQKAEAIAKAGGRSLGKLINVVEGTQITRPVPFLEAAKAAGTSGTPVQPGTQTVVQTVTVTYELN